jgi:succinate dehydrogenase / fumarate reductase cytochrome b subunit
MSDHQGRFLSPPHPVFLQLWRIRLPLPGVVSILHRISGVLMVLALPFGVWLLATAAASPTGFAQAKNLLAQPLMLLILLVLLWAFLHHLFAGIRHLVMDLGQAVELAQARRTALWALGAGLVLTLVLAGLFAGVAV